MTVWDFGIFGLYMVGVLWIGYYFYRRNRSTDDYFVGGRSLSAGHVGLSIVATDVGGGFSIGLGGLGFAMGLAGSWLLLTGLVGAWLSAVFIIPIIKRRDAQENMLSYPDFLRSRYGDERVALLAAVVSALGYLGFTGGQILAGAKLASATLIEQSALGLSALDLAILVIGLIIVAYTVLGGLKAVVYTDTVQWIVLMVGLILLAIPLAIVRIGGWGVIRASLPHSFFSLGNVSAVQVFNWFITIIPIWLVAMTLYQRMFSCRNVKEAQKAWFIAGLFEYPVMAFMGVFLGMCARILFPHVESEMGLPLLIGRVLPAGITGLVVAAYFSAIMSTADSCLLASSGNVVGDILQRHVYKNASQRVLVRLSQLFTLAIGAAAVAFAWVASRFGGVLDVILYAYAFMVSALFIPTLGAYFLRWRSATGALWAMLLGGGTTVLLMVSSWELPWGLDPTFFGIAASALAFVPISLAFPDTARMEATT
ncbi:MAG: sodium:solute symporter family protein [Bradymonadales bacterium]|nr:sodium:solute symporter family protein [Bradymonadales bacterium]